MADGIEIALQRCIFMDMTTVLSQMGVLFAIMAIGFLANKTKILNADANRLLSKLVLSVTLPCTVLNSVMSGDVKLSGSEAVFFFALTLGVYAFGLLLSLVVPHILRVPRSDAGLYRFMTAFANVGFMGFPVIGSIYGSAAAFYVALFNIPFSLLVFSFGIKMIAGKSEKFSLKILINPPFITSVAAFIIFATGFTTPKFFVGIVNTLGNVTTPAAMLIIGSTLAAVPIREVFTEWRIYVFSLIRLLAIPLLTWLILRLFITNEIMLGVLVVLSGMPSATNTTMISMEYGGNDRLASKAVFITTLLSLGSIQLMVPFTANIQGLREGAFKA